MKRQLETIEGSSCDDDSSSHDEATNNTTNTLPTTKQTPIRNNRSRRYVDNIVQQAPPNTTSSLNSTATTTNRNSTSQQQAFEQNSALSFPFVSSSTKVPTNRRHLKLRKQLKTCSNFSSSYFVLDVNAPAANTIGFMGSTRGNDIPVLLTDTVSNTNNNQTPVTNSSSTQPPSKKKTKRAQQNSNNNTNNNTVTFVSNSNKKGGNKKWTTSLVNTNTTITNSLNNNNNTTTTTNSTNPQPTTSTTQQSFQQFVNPMSSQQTMINIPNMGDFQSVLPHTNPQIVSPMNSFQQDFTIQSLLQPSPKNGYQNVQNIPQQNNTFQPSFESMMNCYNNTVMNSPSLGQYSNNSSIDASPPLTSPSTPSTQSNGINSPIIGSLINANMVYQSNSMSSGSFGMPDQNLLNYNSSSDMVNQNNQQQTVCLEDLLSHEDARMLFSLICSQYKNQFQ